ncbi:MAG: hypothetical protein KatS3mg014_0943 [Actinomycetota bacterium]|nr:MAG: hypothetical protein KatS3mg014_0943 [Actinomycetota bacterium]
MLNVPARSPPVPTTSTTGPGASTGVANSSIVRTSPSISSAVSPFVRSAMRNPPICPGVASPAMIERIAAAASSAVSEAPEDRRESTCGHRSRSMGRAG